MKKVFYAPYVMVALALVGIAIAFYDAYTIYNGQALWCPPPVNAALHLGGQTVHSFFEATGC